MNIQGNLRIEIISAQSSNVLQDKMNTWFENNSVSVKKIDYKLYSNQRTIEPNQISYHAHILYYLPHNN